MNLITAIIIDNAFLMSKNNEDVRLAVLENERRQFIDELEEMFDMMDMNSDGTINWEEFEKSFSDPELASKWKLMEFSNEDCLQLFNLLDNGQGIIDMKEFFEGLKQMRGQARAKDVYSLIKMVKKLEHKLDPDSPVHIPMKGFSRGLTVSRRLNEFTKSSSK